MTDMSVMNVIINVFVMLAAGFCLFGMVGEQKDKEAKKGYIYGLLACVIGLVVMNM